VRSAASVGHVEKLSLTERVVDDGKLSLKAGAPRSVLQSTEGGADEVNSSGGRCQEAKLDGGGRRCGRQAGKQSLMVGGARRQS
jgi:hypothetical protein